MEDAKQNRKASNPGSQGILCRPERGSSSKSPLKHFVRWTCEGMGRSWVVSGPGPSGQEGRSSQEAGTVRAEPGRARPHPGSTECREQGPGTEEQAGAVTWREKTPPHTGLMTSVTRPLVPADLVVGQSHQKSLLLHLQDSQLVRVDGRWGRGPAGGPGRGPCGGQRQSCSPG